MQQHKPNVAETELHANIITGPSPAAATARVFSAPFCHNLWWAVGCKTSALSHSPYGYLSRSIPIHSLMALIGLADNMCAKCILGKTNLRTPNILDGFWFKVVCLIWAGVEERLNPQGAGCRFTGHWRSLLQQHFPNIASRKTSLSNESTRHPTYAPGHGTSEPESQRPSHCTG